MAGIVLFNASCKKDPVMVSGITLNNTTANVQVGATSILATIHYPY